jgi:hypothetical protein
MRNRQVKCTKMSDIARSLDFTFNYTYDVLSLNEYTFGDFIDRIYPFELDIKDVTKTARSAS